MATKDIHVVYYNILYYNNVEKGTIMKTQWNV